MQRTIHPASNAVALWETLEPRVMLDAALSALETPEPPNEPVGSPGIAVSIDPADTHQTMDGIGACAYPFAHASDIGWNWNAVRPVVEELDLHYIRSAPWFGYWESANDNSDPYSTNWSAFGDPNDFYHWHDLPMAQYFDNRGIEVSNGIWTPASWLANGTPRSIDASDYDELGEMIATYNRAMRDDGVAIPYAEVQNEPAIEAGVKYPSAYALRDAALEVLDQFDRHGMSDVMLHGPNYHTPTNAANWGAVWLADPALRARTAALSYHTWWSNNYSDYAQIRDLAAQYDKPVWATEIGYLATNINPETWDEAWDYAESHYRALAWSDASRTYHWTVIGHDAAIGTNGEKYPTFYILKHFANFIPPDAVRLGMTSADSSIHPLAFQLPDGKFSVILLNNSSSTKQVDVGFSTGIGATAVEAYRTSQGSYEVSLGVIPPNPSGEILLSLPGESITSMILQPPTVPGDFNFDGVVNAADIDLMLDEIAAGTHGALYDLTGDSQVTQVDAIYLIRGLLGTDFGDANLDGVVSDADYTIWADHYGQTSVGWAEGDFTGNGVVTEADYTIWADHYSVGASSAGASEPVAAAPVEQDSSTESVSVPAQGADDSGASRRQRKALGWDLMRPASTTPGATFRVTGYESAAAGPARILRIDSILEDLDPLQV
jgi:O-glycosyl hydrolase